MWLTKHSELKGARASAIWPSWLKLHLPPFTSSALAAPWLAVLGVLAALVSRVVGQGASPWSVALASAQPDDRAEPRPGFVHAAVEGDLARRDDGDPLAQTLGVSDDVGRKDDGHTVRSTIADQPLELALVDRVQAGKRLVEHDQARLVDQCSKKLDR